MNVSPHTLRETEARDLISISHSALASTVSLRDISTATCRASRSSRSCRASPCTRVAVSRSLVRSCRGTREEHRYDLFISEWRVLPLSAGDLFPGCCTRHMTSFSVLRLSDTDPNTPIHAMTHSLRLSDADPNTPIHAMTHTHCVSLTLTLTHPYML